MSREEVLCGRSIECRQRDRGHSLVRHHHVAPSRTMDWAICQPTKVTGGEEGDIDFALMVQCPGVVGTIWDVTPARENL
ncbi:hypothetical protein V6N11_039840 [Hibiscus sabdariffa]|uniref:Uncharacterized protein n=1 Tax=Hibiscus sabdariffa TaxID=183260 RepID=A0ABR2RFN4_9ROSI